MSIVIQIDFANRIRRLAREFAAHSPRAGMTRARVRRGRVSGAGRRKWQRAAPANLSVRSLALPLRVNGYRPNSRLSQPDALLGESELSRSNLALSAAPSALNATRIDPSLPFQRRETLPSTRSGRVSSSAGFPKSASTSLTVIPTRIRSQLSAVTLSSGRSNQTVVAPASSSTRARLSMSNRVRRRRFIPTKLPRQRGRVNGPFRGLQLRHILTG